MARKGTSASEIDLIACAARHARRVRTSYRALFWSAAPFFAVMGIALILAIVFGRPGHPYDTTPEDLWAGGLMFLFIPILFWMGSEMESLRRACSQLDNALGSEGYDASQNVTVAEIGDLLDATVIGAYSGYRMPAAAALLHTLLGSVHADDHIVLTGGQRQLLHNLIIPGRWNWTSGYAKGVGNSLATQLREDLCPAALHALGILGDKTSIPVLKQFVRKTPDASLRLTADAALAQIRSRMDGTKHYASSPLS